ncbi:Predicted flavoprotein CzcO associated with the cation diffusion facilitator CzcD [Rhizobiales bacterium GAS188]|nr:Predicted flavoprotein CzcO associated with the cation diffusion facilitator CzcD [Rhizobiales bacterium GAS188]
MPDPAAPRNRSVAIVGAGASGLCAARYFKEAGFEVTIYEIGTQVGGLWCFNNDNGLSSAYDTLHINTAKTLTNFSDFRFPPGTQPFPDHRDMHAYFERFVEHYGLRPLIRFSSRVTAIRPNQQQDGARARWIVETDAANGGVFDAVIVASGHLSKPLHVERLASFQGEYLHSHDYREPAPFVGKRVCIVGVGNSACDIASDLATVTPRTVIVARSGVRIAPKLLFGMPFTDVTSRLSHPLIPQWLGRAVTNALIRVIQGPMERLGFKPLKGRSHALSNATIVQHIAYRRVEVKHDIEAVEGRTIGFSDGSKAEFDTLIAATGYVIDLPFLSDSVMPVRDNCVELYNRIVPPDRPGLYFMGLLNLNGAANQAYDRQAPWIVAMETGEAQLPSVDEMRGAIRRKAEWVRRHYPHTPRHTIEEEPIPYFRELRCSLRAARRRADRSRPLGEARSPSGLDAPPGARATETVAIPVGPRASSPALAKGEASTSGRSATETVAVPEASPTGTGDER